VGEASKAAGALAMLGVDIVMLLVGWCSTLLVQRRLVGRSEPDVTGDRRDGNAEIPMLKGMG
jgi:hypothetical protein